MSSLILDGYLVQRLLRSAGVTEVWAALRVNDHLPVVVKSFAIEDNAELEARARREFELIRGLDCDGVVRALSLERSGANLLLVLEAHRGVDLHEHVQGEALAVDSFLAIAVQIAEILARVHEKGVLHRDLKPTNILIDPDDGRVTLADFGISVLLDSERGRIHEPAMVAGTLPYMAPEQTGRSGREVDFRSDLYSLGVCFYELLTGRRPFEAESPLELIHAHFARRPVPPQRLRPELPSALSALVMKLLEKAPERRYQSARGLAADLRRLAAGETFVLGSEDASLVLQLPHQLYGREQERDQLQAALRRTCAGRPELVVLLGPPGIGKSALLDELVEPLLARRGFFARGKFAEDAAEPFSALIS
ncbi:MAG: serine/threonine-protein kinase PknK, partial [Myxococcales bacterium]|nr:serine/threonine-protein kinase PknK [Myxococcales bacterium]